jgi:EmrB/QacA subfamily drug resistance transporter
MVVRRLNEGSGEPCASLSRSIKEDRGMHKLGSYQAVTKERDRAGSDLALYLLCLGVLMIVLDTTIVTVALPSILADLQLSGGSLTWTLNAYMLTFGGFLLLGGRVGDLYGSRRSFLGGIALFTLASLACGLAESKETLLAARAAQGIGGAVVTAVSLALIMNLFTRPVERARALGIYGFVCAAGGGVGELLGGVLTKAFNWHWIFLVNLPIGALVFGFCVVLLPPDMPLQQNRGLDAAGALAITTALTLAVFTLVNGGSSGWLSARTLGSFAAVSFLLLVFLGIESRVRNPLVPLRLFRLRSFTTCNILSALWSAGIFAWFVMAALYLQRVLGYDPLKVGLAFVPAEIIIAAFSLGLSAKLVARHGTRLPLWIGLLLASMGLALFAHAPLSGTFVFDVLPGMLLLGLGAGISSTPLLMAAMSEVDHDEAGLASGIINTSFIMGGALGLAVLVSLADMRVSELQRSGYESIAAVNGGYHVAFLAGALLDATAAVLGALVLRSGSQECVH